MAREIGDRKLAVVNETKYFGISRKAVGVDFLFFNELKAI